MKVWKAEIIMFLQSRITAILASSLFCAAFYEATFIKPNIVERLVLVSTAFVLGWFFSWKTNEGAINAGKSEHDKI